MKKNYFIIIVFFTLLLGCIILLISYTPRKLSNFKDYKNDLLIISESAKKYFLSQEVEEEYLTLGFEDYLEWADDSIEKSIQKISEIDLEYIWVSDDYVIFWNNEMKTYGILYSTSSKTIIKQLKSWYTGMEYHKIEKNWYEIGELSSI